MLRPEFCVVLFLVRFHASLLFRESIAQLLPPVKMGRIWRLHSKHIFGLLGKARKEKEPVWGDSAYRSEEIEKKLSKKGFTSKIHEKGYRGKPLTEHQKASNTIKSRIRARVEHIFGSIRWFKGDYLRCIGIDRITEAVGFINLSYNMKRYCIYA